MTNISFDNLPDAVARIFIQLEKIEQLIAEKSQPPAPDPFMDVAEVAAFLRLTAPTVYGLVHRSEIPHHKKGNRLYFLKSEIKDWVKASRRRTRAEIKSTL